MKNFDIIVFGATGFTGQEIAKYLYNTVSAQDSSLRLAIAGRNKEKLIKIKEMIIDECDDKDVSIILADTKNKSSLSEMAKQSRLLINCVGPFRFHGIDVVEACSINGCHYLDISGEPQFIELCHLKYHDEAKKNKTLIIPASGYDSIPADVGVQFIIQEAKKQNKELISIESFMRFIGEEEGFKAHFTTYESAVHGFANWNKLSELRGDLKKKRWPTKVKWTDPSFSIKKYPFYELREKSWCFLFPAADSAVVRSTQKSLSTINKDLTQPKYAAYYSFIKPISVFIGLFTGFMFLALTKSSLGRSILLKYPRFFSAGVITKSGPTKKQLSKTSFRINFFGRFNGGAIQTRISGPEPGYVATPIMIVQAAFYLLNHEKNIENFGVFTPGVILKDEKYISQLRKCGITFEVIN
ncbi:saccharopine dehydrogenase NADP-binding domain-containing protein [Bacteriovoracaceae bacterium]|nr:saccharopine dehydrogenase NADP-binding domain-containing protein [Bacteriovoracaceae bacterium]